MMLIIFYACIKEASLPCNIIKVKGCDLENFGITACHIHM